MLQSPTHRPQDYRLLLQMLIFYGLLNILWMTQQRLTEGTRLIYMRADYTLETAGVNNIELGTEKPRQDMTESL